MLKVTKFSCIRNEQEIFSDLTFSISPGMLLQLSGPNGSGKSSLLKMIAGLLPIERGIIQSPFINHNMKQSLTSLLAEDPNYLSNLLYLGHKTGLTLSLSARENLILWQNLRCNTQTLSDNQGQQSQSYLRIDAILAELNLSSDADKLCEVLSAGQKQKVVLSRLWYESAPLWLLDEPFTAIDKGTQQTVEALIERHLDQGGAVIMANHSEMNLPKKLGNHYQVLEMGTRSDLAMTGAKYNRKNFFDKVAAQYLVAFKAAFRRDVLLYTRHQSETFLPLIFFIMIASIFSISMGSSTTALSAFAGPILWVGVLLSILLSAESLYRNDYESGYLEHLLLNPMPLTLFLWAKMMAHILCIGLPLLVIVPILGILLHLPIESLSALFFSFLIGIPALCFITSIGSAITVSLRRGGLLLSILLIPLMIPVIIFGCSALQLVNSGLTWRAECYLLCAILLISVVLSPMISALAIKLGLD